MKTVPLNGDLLDLIMSVQAAKQLFLSEGFLQKKGYDAGLMLKSDEDWREKTRKYFSSLSPALFSSAGVHKNELCFRSILDFKLSQLILDAPEDDLGKFTFTF